MMPSAVALVFTHPTSSEVEGEFNQWYSDVHVKDVLAVPGVSSAVRYKLSDLGQPGSDSAQAPYMLVMGIEADDVQHVLDDIGARAGTEQMPISPTLAFKGDKAPKIIVYEPVD